ncbi:MAG: hypothetical protein COB26_11940 [Piscirickettsiaceae bacterium]|nr:MAG: hypothetical protein COB89_02415 [Piscirickettsiaceae bacterium]PCI65993.1 MAG: hypothetical protein COB26_11940 [Piscirickettsiaceae bacterium]
MIENFITPDFIKFFLPLAGAVIAWVLNERRKRTWEEYRRKEECYSKLLASLTGFYTYAADAGVRSKFIEEYKKSWMYCSDEVIKAMNQMIYATKVGSTVTPECQREIIGGLIVEIRKDLLNRKLTKKTKLNPKDYIHVGPGN